MATGKRYYWLKLKDSFVDSDAFDFMMSRGPEYVVLYLMLCFMAMNTDGHLVKKAGEYSMPYDTAMIQRDCKWFGVETVRDALTLYKGLGLITDESGEMVLADYSDMVGSELDWAEQKRRQRGQRVDNGVDNVHSNGVDNSVDNVHTEIRDKRLEIREKREETRDQEIEVEEGEPAELSATPAPSKFTIPLMDGSGYNVPADDVQAYGLAYPNVDVSAQLQRMIEWATFSGNNHNTMRNVRQFITRWLTEEQGKAVKITTRPNPAMNYTQRPLTEIDDEAWQRESEAMLLRLAEEAEKGDQNADV